MKKILNVKKHEKADKGKIKIFLEEKKIFFVNITDILRRSDRLRE